MTSNPGMLWSVSCFADYSHRNSSFRRILVDAIHLAEPARSKPTRARRSFR